MTVKELKELLETMNDDSIVTFVNGSGKELEVKETWETKLTNELIMEIE